MMNTPRTPSSNSLVAVLAPGGRLQNYPFMCVAVLALDVAAHWSLRTCLRVVWLCLRLGRPALVCPEKPLCVELVSFVAANRRGESQRPSPDAHVTIPKLKFRGGA